MCSVTIRKFITIFQLETSLHNSSAGSTNLSSTCFLHLPHTKSLHNLGVILFTLTYLPWIHFPHFPHNTEFAITHFPQIPHGSTLLTDTSPSALLTLPEVHRQPLALECLLHFQKFSLSSSIVSLVRTKSFKYNMSLIKPFLTFSVTTSTRSQKPMVTTRIPSAHQLSPQTPKATLIQL